MKTRSVTYTGSFASAEEFPKAVGPEFVFIGRSNVGKSAVINTLVGRKNIARTSNTPGKTRTANFYVVNEAFCFVDVPGDGYAKVAKTERAHWQKLTAKYIASRDVLAGIVHILDARHDPSKEDRETARVLREAGRPVCLVFNKVDKVKKRHVERQITESLQALEVDPRTAVVPFSAELGEGRGPLWAWIEELL